MRAGNMLAAGSKSAPGEPHLRSPAISKALLLRAQGRRLSRLPDNQRSLGHSTLRATPAGFALALTLSRAAATRQTIEAAILNIDARRHWLLAIRPLRQSAVGLMLKANPRPSGWGKAPPSGVGWVTLMRSYWELPRPRPIAPTNSTISAHSSTVLRRPS
jgi:hypothetical protein